MENPLQSQFDTFFQNLPVEPPPQRQVRIDFYKEYIRQAKEKIYQIHLTSKTGVEILHLHSALIDQVVQSVYTVVLRDMGVERVPFAVLARGGYGRKEMHPYSDIDIAFLSRDPLDEMMGNIATSILHYLWDIGFDLGHSLCTMEDCVRYSSDDLISLTALMDARLLAGEEEIFNELQNTIFQKILKDNSVSYISGKLQEMKVRHQHFDSSLYHLQPNIKIGVGGLRDIQTALWVAQARFRVRHLEDLERLGALTETERLESFTYLDFLWRVRNDLHYQAKRKQDILTYQYQYIISKDLGFKDDPKGTPIEHFMQEYYRSARHILEYSNIYISRCLPKGYPGISTSPATTQLRPGIFIKDDTIQIIESQEVILNPVLILLALSEVQKQNLPLSIGTKTIIRDGLDSFQEDDFLKSEARDIFLAMLADQGNLGESLHEMHDLGILEMFIPEFRDLTCLVRHDLQHRYTVDEHTLRLVGFLQELKNHPEMEKPEKDSPPKELIRVYHEVNQHQVLMFTGLLHDIGKTAREKHVEAGLKVIPTILRRLGLGQSERDSILSLVEIHHLMSEVTQHHDLDDNRILLDFARSVESLDMLKMLYCITYADMKAVGPEVWNPWKAVLLSELYHKAHQIITGENISTVLEGQEIEEEKNKIIQEYNEVLTAEEINIHFQGMSSRYLLGTAPAMIVEHLLLIRKLKSPSREENKDTLSPGISSLPDSVHPVYTLIQHNSQVGYSNFTICTMDMPGLFAKIAGTLASKGISILGAQIFTRVDGVVLDTLQLDHESPGWTDEPLVWIDIEDELHAVINGQEDIQAILVNRRKYQKSANHTTLEVPTEIYISPDISDTHTVVEIRTQDRIGLLFTLTNTFSQLNLNITTARIATYGMRAVDVFYITDLEGKKITQRQKLSVIETTLIKALAEI